MKKNIKKTVILKRSIYSERTEFISLKKFKVEFHDDEKLRFYFTQAELKKFDFEKKAESLACRYLTKMIILEKLDCISRFKEVEIFNDENGKPEIFLSTGLKQVMTEQGISKIFCSLSHSREVAASFVVFETV